MVTDTNGCTSMSDPVEVIITGTQETDTRLEEVRIVPNPNTGKFRVVANESSSIHISVLNLLGQCVYSGSIGDEKIDLSSAPPGIYFVIIDMGGHRYLRSVVIQ
jgi:hypothetical protein